MHAPRFLLRASVVLGLLAGPASAQVTPEQVWTFWQGLAQGAGYQMTATAQRRDGARLILDGVEAAQISATTSFRAPVGQVVMRDLGDGTVEITVPPRFEITMAIREPDRDPVDMALTVEQDGYVTVVSGTPEAPRYTVSADALTVTVPNPVVDGKAMPMDLVVTLGGIRGATLMVPGAPFALSYDLSAEAIEIAMSAEDPQGDGTFDLSVGAQSLASQFEGTLPATIAPGTPLSDAMAAGLRGSGSYGAQAIDFGMDLTGKGGTTSVAGSAAGGMVDFGLDPAGLRYRTGLTGLAVAASGAGIPVPDLQFSMAEYALGLTMPLVKSDTPSDFGFLLRLVDLVVSDDVWALVDPQAALPRDPATLILDTTGKVTLFHDLTSPEAERAPVPGQVEQVTIDALQLKAMGADLTGTGAFAFDNADTATFPGFPRPFGTADLLLTGGNALLDRLTALGFVPAEQVFMVRAIMAMVATPGAGPDTLTSRLEITPDARILANGQRLR